MSRGIILLAVKNPVYGKFAFNMALSLKAHNPALPVQLIADTEGISGLNQHHLQLFDTITEVDKWFSLLIDRNGKERFTPAKAKLGLYPYAAFDENIFLDADGVCVAPVAGLWKLCTGKSFATQLFDYCDARTKEFPSMLWAHPQEAWKHFGLTEDMLLPATNTSFMYFIKDTEQPQEDNHHSVGVPLAGTLINSRVQQSVCAQQIFNTALHELQHNPLPHSRHRLKWGTGQPDELYLNVALAKLNYNAALTKPYVIYFSNRRMNSAEEITAKFSLIGLYGPRGFVHSTIVDYCDRVIHKLCREKGIPHEFKYSKMMREKFQHKRY